MEYLNENIIAKIDNLLDEIYSQNRQKLFEHEVYQILEWLGLNVPPHAVVHNPDQICAELLDKFGSKEIVFKVISSDIPHKRRVGGIHKIIKDVDFARYMFEKMTQEISRHPSFEKPAEIEGFLITNYVDYSKDLGNESLISFRENNSFGPVLSFAKGGTDAEHFARHYHPPHLRLTPLTREECQQIMANTRIILKYQEESKLDYVEKTVDALYKFNLLASHYSSFNPQQPRFVITEFEVNPFVFDYNRNFIAIDGLASFELNETSYRVIVESNTNNLDVFFRPKGVSVIGVSATDSKKVGNTIATLLHNLNRDDLFFINPKGGTVAINGKTYKLYKSLSEIEDQVDLAVVTIPAKFTPEIIKEVKTKRVRGVILIPGGFSEVSGDQTLEQEVLDIVRGTDIRIVGPNCIGVYYAKDDNQPGLNTIFLPEKKFQMPLRKKRNVAIITQSGAMGISELDKLRHAIGPKVVVSYGNQLDVDPGDLAAYFDQDPDIDVIAIYIEGFKPFGGREFYNVAKKINKPTIVYKAGRTDAGSRAAASHTASMAGDYEVARAAFLQAGIIVTDSILDHKDLIKTFALQGNKTVKGRKVAGIVNAGFESTYAADSIGNLQLASFTENTVTKLNNILPDIVGINPFLDLTPMADDSMFEKCTHIVLEDPNVDLVFISIVPHTGSLHTAKEEIEWDKENIATRIIRQAQSSDKPILVSVNAGTQYNLLVDTLEEGGVPTYSTAERAMNCLNRLVDYKLK